MHFHCHLLSCFVISQLYTYIITCLQIFRMDMVRVPFGGGMEQSGVTGANIRHALQSRVPDMSSNEQSSAWHALWGQTAAQARLLTERLRLVLEPTGLSRLAGTNLFTFIHIFLKQCCLLAEIIILVRNSSEKY